MKTRPAQVMIVCVCCIASVRLYIVKSALYVGKCLYPILQVLSLPLDDGTKPKLQRGLSGRY